MAKNYETDRNESNYAGKNHGESASRNCGKNSSKNSSGNSSRNSSKSSYGNKISDEYDSEKDRGSDRYYMIRKAGKARDGFSRLNTYKGTFTRKLPYNIPKRGDFFHVSDRNYLCKNAGLLCGAQ